MWFTRAAAQGMWGWNPSMDPHGVKSSPGTPGEQRHRHGAGARAAPLGLAKEPHPHHTLPQLFTPSRHSCVGQDSLPGFVWQISQLQAKAVKCSLGQVLGSAQLGSFTGSWYPDPHWLSRHGGVCSDLMIWEVFYNLNDSMIL